MHGCSMGIAAPEHETADEYNPNVALEYGFMRALGKNVLLLKERHLRKSRADILRTVWLEFDAADITISIDSAIQRWFLDLA